MIRTLRFQGPFQGVNKAVDSSYLGVLEAEEAMNVVLDKGTLLKRSGFNEVFVFDATNDGRIQGVYDFIKNDGTIRTLIASGSNLYAVTFANGVLTSSSLIVGGGITPGTLVAFQTVNNRAYLANGAVFKVTDGTSLFDASLQNPPLPTVTVQVKRVSYPGGAEVVGTGKLTGIYDYVYTWYSSTWGQESQASQPSQFLTYVNDNRVLTFAKDVNGTNAFSVPNDARIDKMRIYRRKTSAGESDWSFVAEVSVTPGGFAPEFDDTKGDVDVDRFRKAPTPSSTGTISDFSFMAYQAGVLFLAGSAQFPNRLYYTATNKPYVLQGFLEVGSGGDNEPITGIASFLGNIYVFKSGSIWILSGDTKETFFCREIVPNIGCRSHFSIVNVENLLFFLSQKGFYTFDGAEVREISEKVKPDILTRNQLLDKLCVGVHDPERGMILWAYVGAGSTVCDKLIAYYYRNARAIEDDSWCPWTFQNETVSQLSLVADTSTRVQSLCFGFEDGKLGIYGGDSDDGNPIPFLWRTGKQSGGVPETIKNWDEATIQFRTQPVATNLSLDFYLDSDLSSPEPFTHDMTDPIFRCRVGRSSSEIRWEFEANSVGGCEIVGWTQRAELLDDA